jgi:hypothetical protein
MPECLYASDWAGSLTAKALPDMFDFHGSGRSGKVVANVDD